MKQWVDCVCPQISVANVENCWLRDSYQAVPSTITKHIQHSIGLCINIVLVLPCKQYSSHLLLNIYCWSLCANRVHSHIPGISSSRGLVYHTHSLVLGFGRPDWGISIPYTIYFIITLYTWISLSLSVSQHINTVIMLTQHVYLLTRHTSVCSTLRRSIYRLICEKQCLLPTNLSPILSQTPSCNVRYVPRLQVSNQWCNIYLWVNLLVTLFFTVKCSVVMLAVCLLPLILHSYLAILTGWIPHWHPLCHCYSMNVSLVITAG